MVSFALGWVLVLQKAAAVVAVIRSVTRRENQKPLLSSVWFAIPDMIKGKTHMPMPPAVETNPMATPSA